MRRSVFEAVGEMYGVGIDELTVTVTFVDILPVGIRPFVIGALDTTSRRCVIARRSEAYLSAVLQGEHALHQSLAV